MRGRARPLLPIIVRRPDDAHHRCVDCGVDLCADLLAFGFDQQLAHQLHRGGGGYAGTIVNTRPRCLACERDERRSRS